MLRLQELRNRSPWGGKAAVRFHLTRLLESPRAHSYPLSHQISRRTQSFGVQSLFWRIERRGAARRRGAGSVAETSFVHSAKVSRAPSGRQGSGAKRRAASALDQHALQPGPPRTEPAAAPQQREAWGPGGGGGGGGGGDMCGRAELGLDAWSPLRCKECGGVSQD